jgi:hypothetical protein
MPLWKKKTSQPTEPALKSPAPAPVSADRIHGLLAETVSMGAFNITIGGDGSIEMMKNSEIVKDARLPVAQETFMLDVIKWLRDVTGDRVPKGLRLDDDLIDLDGSVYTFPIEGSKIDIEGINHIDVGIYSREVSPEAACKNCYVVFKPSYAEQANDA